ncbi:ATP synthase subunit beta like [Quillaja saponaria]|uniref:ATP synthase subunit beta like n=1 Tax=Quillaja saponaria TaxID=32244 RepID=A0AAD7KSS0_QUISA|nr:ATP synthase subunit beta like [Quillaja saponaria]
MGGAQALKRIPRIKFPQRRAKPSGSASETQPSSSASDANLPFFSSSKASTTLGGKASLQPKRTPVSNEEIEAILLGGSF